jgi:hypothetical protein
MYPASVRPPSCRGPVWCSRIGSRSKPRAQGTLLHTGSPDPVSRRLRQTTPCPLVLRRPRDRRRLTPPWPEPCRRHLSGHQGPDDPRHLVRQRHPHQHWWLARQHAAQPGAGSGRRMDMPLDDDAVGTNDQQAPQRSLAHSLSSPRAAAFPPVECCRGTSPSQAAKSRPCGRSRAAVPGPRWPWQSTDQCLGSSSVVRATSFSLARRLISAFSFPISVSR